MRTTSMLCCSVGTLLLVAAACGPAPVDDPILTGGAAGMGAGATGGAGGTGGATGGTGGATGGTQSKIAAASGNRGSNILKESR